MDHTNNNGFTPQQQEALKKFAEDFSGSKLLTIETLGLPKWVMPEGWSQDESGNWHKEEKGKWAEKQLTREQAIAFAKSREWESWTDEQIVRFQLFQRKVCVDFGRYHKALSNVLGRSVYTHEIQTDALKEEYLGTRKAPTMEEIINLIPEDKRLFFNF